MTQRAIALPIGCLALIFVCLQVAARPPVREQARSDAVSPRHALRLASVGSFFVGGAAVDRSAVDVGLYGGGRLTIGQMYVQYMIPEASSSPPIVMVHGGTLTGKSFETTPDGRMGWYEYFARNGFPSYVVDQVGRGRSGFDHAQFNEVRAGHTAPVAQPNLRRVADGVAWVRFRMGPAAGVPYDDGQFPIQAAAEFSKQTVPDLSQTFSADDPNPKLLSELGRQLRGAILMGHSQAGRYPFEAALHDSAGIKALVALEPPGCDAERYSDAQIVTLAKIPILVVFGDHLATPQTFGPGWEPLFRDCQAFVARVNAAGGRATLLHTPDAGIRGNSHMLMLDRNNLRIADLIIDWIGRTSQ